LNLRYEQPSITVELLDEGREKSYLSYWVRETRI